MNDVNKPFHATWQLVVASMPKEMKYKHLRPWHVLAVAIKESFGISYFCLCDSLAKANLSVMSTTAGVKEQDFVKEFTVRTGEHVGSFGKFRFEPSWWLEIEKSGHFDKLPLVQRVGMACSWGAGQKSAWYKFGKMPSDVAISLLKGFIADPAEQFEQIWDDLEALGFEDGVDPALVFSRYNAGASCKKVTEYGADVLRLSGIFGTSYATEKF